MVNDGENDYFEIKKNSKEYELRSFYDSNLKNDRINLHPEYQRDFVWNAYKQNLLIDSIMRSFVVPHFIFIKDYSGKYKQECIDGHHRLTVIKHFITGKKLKGNYVRWRKKIDGTVENIFYE